MERIVRFDFCKGYDLIYNDTSQEFDRCKKCHYDDTNSPAKDVCGICSNFNGQLFNGEKGGCCYLVPISLRPMPVDNDIAYEIMYEKRNGYAELHLCDRCEVREYCFDGNKICKNIIDPTVSIYFKKVMKEEKKTNDELDNRAYEASRFITQNENLMEIITNSKDADFDKFCERFKKVVKLFI